MPFLTGKPYLDARLVHHTGSMIRFVTSQLPYLPTRDTACTVHLPDGQEFAGHFHRHPQNPYVAGAP
jgi:hypothetical protein